LLALLLAAGFCMPADPAEARPRQRASVAKKEPPRSAKRESPRSRREAAREADVPLPRSNPLRIIVVADARAPVDPHAPVPRDHPLRPRPVLAPNPQPAPSLRLFAAAAPVLRPGEHAIPTEYVARELAFAAIVGETPLGGLPPELLSGEPLYRRYAPPPPVQPLLAAPAHVGPPVAPATVAALPEPPPLPPAEPPPVGPSHAKSPTDPAPVVAALPEPPPLPPAEPPPAAPIHAKPQVPPSPAAALPEPPPLPPAEPPAPVHTKAPVAPAPVAALPEPPLPRPAPFRAKPPVAAPVAVLPEPPIPEPPAAAPTHAAAPEHANEPSPETMVAAAPMDGESANPLALPEQEPSAAPAIPDEALPPESQVGVHEYASLDEVPEVVRQLAESLPECIPMETGARRQPFGERTLFSFSCPADRPDEQERAFVLARDDLGNGANVLLFPRPGGKKAEPLHELSNPRVAPDTQEFVHTDIDPQDRPCREQGRWRVDARGNPGLLSWRASNSCDGSDIVVAAADKKDGASARSSRASSKKASSRKSSRSKATANKPSRAKKAAVKKKRR
jgi:hypothetical protein